MVYVTCTFHEITVDLHELYTMHVTYMYAMATDVMAG